MDTPHDARSITARLYLARPGFTLDVDLRLPGRGVTALFGPSGCGKTTCLRAIAGLERAKPGQVVVNAEVWQDDTAQVWRTCHQWLGAITKNQRRKGCAVAARWCVCNWNFV